MSGIRKDLLGVWQFSVLKLLSCVSEKYQNESRRLEGRYVGGKSSSLYYQWWKERSQTLHSKLTQVLLHSAPPEYGPGECCLKHSCFTVHNVKTSPLGGLLQMVWFLLTYWTSQTCLPQACKHEAWTDLLRKKRLCEGTTITKSCLHWQTWKGKCLEREQKETFKNKTQRERREELSRGPGCLLMPYNDCETTEDRGNQETTMSRSQVDKYPHQTVTEPSVIAERQLSC